MEILKSFKFRLYPTEAQQAELAKQFGHSRFVYNRFVDTRKTTFLQFCESVSFYDFKRQVTAMKKLPEFTWLKEADSQVLQAALEDADRAYQNFFRMHRDGTLPKPGKKPRKDGMPKGYPKFHSKHDDQSIRYPQRFKFKNNQIYLPKVGWVHLHKHRTLWGKPKNVTVSKTKNGKYFVSVQCQMEVAEPKPASGEVGIDLGLKSFVKLTTGEDIAPPQHYRKAERRLKIRQRAISRKIKGSSSRTKAKLVVAATHEKVRNQRLDFQHKLSRQIVNANGLIAFEDLNIKGMMQNHHLAKSIGDAGWSQFVNFVTYKAAWAGGQVLHVDRFFPSSKLCSVCGSKNAELKMSDRVWQCTNCQTIHDRDANAAVNILKQATLGARESASLTSNAGGDMSQLVKPSAPENFGQWTQQTLWPTEAHPL